MKASDWISVKDKLPELHCDVGCIKFSKEVLLCVNNDDVLTARLVCDKSDNTMFWSATRGRKMTDEQKLKMSNAQKGKKLSSENPQSKAVIQFDKQMILIKTWQCISDASKALNISISAISNCLKGLSKTSGGYIWRYA